jgi:halimadienyl-diphosphate synthase
MNVFEEVHTFLAAVGGNVTDSCAYDTALLAALRAPGTATPRPAPRFPECLAWLRSHQHADGSWGAPWSYYHDRLVATLRALLTLQQWRDDAAEAEDAGRMARGLAYIWRNAARLAQDPWETAGFELIFPMLLDQAQAQGLALPYSAFAPVQQMRRAHLAQAPAHLAYDPILPLAANLEMLDVGFERARAARVQASNGSVGMSPAATAFWLQHGPDDGAAQAYLQRAVRGGADDGGAPTCWPLETWERGWALLHLQHALPTLYADMADATTPVLQFLYDTRRPTGWAPTVESAVKDADSTSVCYTVLGHAGYELDPRLLYQYEEAQYFRGHARETSPAIGANAHVLGALRYCDARERRPRIDKIVRFLCNMRQPGGFWFARRHSSPYYTTSHIILAAHDSVPGLVEEAVAWLVHTPWPEGGWGYYHTATLEETAYAVLALLVWRDAGHAVPPEVIRRGVNYLRERFDPAARDYPPLWIGKGLLAPVQVVQSAILAALLAWEVRR